MLRCWIVRSGIVRSWGWADGAEVAEGALTALGADAAEGEFGALLADSAEGALRALGAESVEGALGVDWLVCAALVATCDEGPRGTPFSSSR